MIRGDCSSLDTGLIKLDEMAHVIRWKFFLSTEAL